MAGADLLARLPVDPLPSYYYKDVFGRYKDVIRQIIDDLDQKTIKIETSYQTLTTDPVSIGLSLPTSVFAVSGSPITKAGTLTATLINQAVGLVFAGPSSGDAAAPVFRALADTDIPATLVRTTRQISTTAPLAGGGSLSGNLALSIPPANGSTDGYLAKEDWATFNSRLASLPIASATVLGGIKVGSGLVIDSVSGILSVSGTSNTGAGETDSTYYVFEQSTPASQWLIRHDLGKVPTGLLVVVNGEVISPAVLIGPAASTAYYTHTQSAAASTWVVDHALGEFPTGLTVVDDSGEISDPAVDIDQNPPYQVRLHFNPARSGKAYLSTGAASYPVTLTFSAPYSGKAYLSIGAHRVPYKHTQDTPATEWVVSHDLGRVPTAIRVFDAANNVVEDPGLGIMETEPYTLTLRFLTAIAGVAYVS